MPRQKVNARKDPDKGLELRKEVLKEIERARAASLSEYVDIDDL